MSLCYVQRTRKYSSLTLREAEATFYFPNIIFSRDILVQQQSQCTVGGVAVSAQLRLDQSCPKNQDKWIQNQKQTHLRLGKLFSGTSEVPET